MSKFTFAYFLGIINNSNTTNIICLSLIVVIRTLFDFDKWQRISLRLTNIESMRTSTRETERYGRKKNNHSGHLKYINEPCCYNNIIFFMPLSCDFSFIIQHSTLIRF